VQTRCFSAKETLGPLEEKSIEEDIMPTFEEGAAFTQAILPEYSKRASYKPAAEEAAKAKALINFLMQDQFFLALYRSNDPKVRAGAIDKLNHAHHQAYGDASTQDGDADGGTEQ
jgi:hypothetical protein